MSLMCVISLSDHYPELPVPWRTVGGNRVQNRLSILAFPWLFDSWQFVSSLQLLYKWREQVAFLSGNLKVIFMSSECHEKQSPSHQHCQWRRGMGRSYEYHNSEDPSFWMKGPFLLSPNKLFRTKPTLFARVSSYQNKYGLYFILLLLSNV